MATMIVMLYDQPVRLFHYVLVVVVVLVFYCYFRLPPNSFTSLYHDDTQESLVKGNLYFSTLLSMYVCVGCTIVWENFGIKKFCMVHLLRNLNTRIFSVTKFFSYEIYLNFFLLSTSSPP